MKGRDQKTEFFLVIFGETDHAYTVGKDIKKPNDVFWLPKRVVSVEPKTVVPKSHYSITIPNWLAEQKGLDPSLDGVGYSDDDERVME